MPQCLLDSPKVLYSEGSIDRKPLSLSGLRLGLGFAVRLTFGLSHLWTINTIDATMNHNSETATSNRFSARQTTDKEGVEATDSPIT